MTHETEEPKSWACTQCGEYAGTPVHDHIAELEAKNRELHMQILASDSQAQMAYEQQERLEAKLARAVATLEYFDGDLADRNFLLGSPYRAKARATLAELKGTD